ncbi:hypothetical protein [Vibrio harveyi]|uniref:hypothetical protein n=1 Tax=Vibrio harveyi TaxID=669 RepID=UPI003CE80037
MKLTDHEEAYNADWIYELRDEQLKRLYESNFINWRSTNDVIDDEKKSIQYSLEMGDGLRGLCSMYQQLHEQEAAVYIGDTVYVFDKKYLIEELIESGVRAERLMIVDRANIDIDDFFKLLSLVAQVDNESVIAEISQRCKSKLTVEMFNAAVMSIPYESSNKGFDELAYYLAGAGEPDCDGDTALCSESGRKYFISFEERERLWSYFGARSVVYDEKGSVLDANADIISSWTFAIGDYVHPKRFDMAGECEAAFLFYLLNEKGCKLCPQMPKDFTKNMTIEQVVEAVDDAINGMYGFG